MSGFANSILGGAKKLIREAIESLNYVAGISGWSIMRNGFAEFANAVIRGSLSANNGQIILDSNGLSVTGTEQLTRIDVFGIFRMRQIPDTGSALVLRTAAGFGGVLQMQPENSTVVGNTFDNNNIFADSEETLTTSVALTAVTSPGVNGLNKGRLYLYSQSSDSAFDNSYIRIFSARGIYWHDYEVDSGRGYVTGVGVTASPAATIAEAVVLTVPATDYWRNRAYNIKLTGMVVALSSPNNVLIRFRKTNAAGVQIDVCRVRCQTAQTYNSSFEAFFTVAAPQNITLVVTIQSEGGGFSSQLTASANSPASCTVYDVGDAANFPWALTL